MNMIAKTHVDSFCSTCPTRAHCIARGLSEADLAVLRNCMRPGRTLAGGKHLFLSGDPATHQYHVRSGTLMSYHNNQGGDEFVTGFYLAGDVVPNFVVDGTHRHSVVALEHASVCAIRQSPDAGTLNGLPGSVWSVLTRYAHDASTRALSHQLNLKIASAEARFAGFCVEMMRRLKSLHRDPTDIPTPMRRTDIASYLGLTLESLSRVMSRLSRRGIICADRQYVKVLDEKTLTSLAPHLS